MALIYSPSRGSIMMLLVTLMSSSNSAAFTHMKQPAFGSRTTMSDRQSALFMVGSEDYLKKLQAPSAYEQEYMSYEEAEAWMPEIPTPEVQEELIQMEMGEDVVVAEESVVDESVVDETAVDSFVQSGIEEAADFVADMQAEFQTGQDSLVVEPQEMIMEEPLPEPVEMVMEEPEPEIAVMEQTPVISEPPKVETIPRAHAIVPINEATIEFTSGVVGGVAGFALAGPAGSVFGASVFNFLSRQVEGDLTEAISNTAKKSIELYNYMAKLDAKYQILARSKKSLSSSIHKIKSSKNISPEALEAAEKMELKLALVAKKIDDINGEYDLTNNLILAFDKFGDIVERTVKKSVEFEKKNNVSGKLMQAWSQAIEKALEAAEETRSK